MIDGLSKEQARTIPKEALHDYFCAYVRYDPDAPQAKYVIRIGTSFLRAANTLELREMFERHVQKLKRQRTNVR